MHPIAQGLHCFGLPVDGLRNIIAAQRLFGLIHRPSGAVERIPRRVSLGCSLGWQPALLAQQLVAQRILPLGQRALLILTGAALARRIALPGLALPRQRARLARLLALPLLAVTLPPLALTRLIARLLSRLPGVELILQIAERIIRQALLIAQRILQSLHGFLSG